MPTEPAQPAPTPRSSTSTQRTGQVIARSLVISGVATIIVAIVLGATVEPFLYAIAIIGLLDFVFAALFARGRIGPRPTGAAAAEIAQSDPTYNPYARED